MTGEPLASDECADWRRDGARFQLEPPSAGPPSALQPWVVAVCSYFGRVLRIVASHRAWLMRSFALKLVIVELVIQSALHCPHGP